MQKHPRKKMQVVRHVLEGTETSAFSPPLLLHSSLSQKKTKTKHIGDIVC